MERIQALIDKLNQQKQQNATPAQLLLTVQLLQSELLKFQHRNGTLGTAKVAVTLPANMNFPVEIAEQEEIPTEIKPAAPVKFPEPVAKKEEPVHNLDQYKPSVNLEQYKSAVASPVEEQKPVPEEKEYKINKPVVKEEVHEKPEPVYAYSQQVLNPAFTPMDESPTLVQHFTGRKEVHEVIAEKKESLNDRLKQEKTEVVQVLKETPIKDLRKGIGINDRFTFVNDLFRGDDAMYERSIKTINGFHILSEAEYWINRELKFKLGWNDNKDTVQHFYQLVRRRFS